MNEAEKFYLNKIREGAIIRKRYVNCPSCNAINNLVPQDVVYEKDEQKYYRITCWSCKKEFEV